MMYSIIPPILVVMSLIGIILFLLRKSSDVARIEEFGMREESLPKRGIIKNTIGKINGGGEPGKGIQHHSLLVLEKLTRRFKVFFLKMENTFTSWNESIRKKRKNQLTEMQASAPEDRNIKSVLEKLKEKESQPENPAIQEIFSQEETSPEQLPAAPRIREKIVRPMISERVVRPKFKKAEIKDRLEKILIERIAANPKDTEAYERLGEYYFEIENYNYAKECFKQVIKLDPANNDAKMRMKKLGRLLGR